MKADFKNIFKKFYVKLQKKAKLLFYILIFIAVCTVYNQNFQPLNFILKRGTVLEYSCPLNAQINKDSIRKQLLEFDIKYSFVDIEDNLEFDLYDSDEELIKLSLYIALPILPREDRAEVFNKISDFVFDSYPDSKLINLRSLSNLYPTPFGSLLSFLGLAGFSFVIYFILLCLFIRPKNAFDDFKNSCLGFCVHQKNSIVSLVKKTKENGMGYFFKKLLFDDNEKEEDINITKEVIYTVVFVLVCVIVIRYFIGELRWIPSGSMRPTIIEKDRVFVEKIHDLKNGIKRGDILVFYPPETTLSNSPFAILSRLTGIFCKDIAFIKRVVGMPNDKLEVRYNEKSGEYRVYINDKALNEPYINSNVNWSPCIENMYCGPMTIPEGHYFMMGDNRGNSQDSRFWGFLDANRIIGRANFMFFPLSRINVLKDRYINLHKQKTENGITEEKFIVNRYEFLYKI